jgi:hypothetical protein
MIEMNRRRPSSSTAQAYAQHALFTEDVQLMDMPYAIHLYNGLMGCS